MIKAEWTKADALDLQPTCNQLEIHYISRQAAINAANRADYTGLALEDVKKVTDEVIKEIKKLPSIQSEIIHCKDCKNSEHWYGDRRRCFLWSEDGVSVFNDGFCNYAERRTDEQR